MEASVLGVVGLAAVQCGEIGWKEALWFLVLKRSACDLVRCDVCSPLQAITVVFVKVTVFLCLTLSQVRILRAHQGNRLLRSLFVCNRAF